MAALPVEVVLGLYLGLLTGIIPALVAWTLGFTFKYFTGVTVPALAVVVLGVAIAGVNGGLLALVDPTITTLPNNERVVVAILIVMMMSLYAHAQGDRLGTTFPRRLSLRRLRERTLSTDVVELVGGRGQVRVRVVGEVADVEGWPPLPPETRAAIASGEWAFPADLPLSEIERRLADRLRSAHRLDEVQVAVDERARATVAAAPAPRGVSTRLGAGRRAVSVPALVPTGLARGDEVTLVLDGEDAVAGTVVSARSTVADDADVPAATAPAAEGAEAGASTATTRPRARAGTTEGGDGRVTVAVARGDAERVLQAERAHVVVGSRGTRGEFELLAVLRRAGTRLRRYRVAEDGSLDGSTLGEVGVRDRFHVVVLAVRDAGGWDVAPDGSTALRAGDELFAVGATADLEQFREALGA